MPSWRILLLLFLAIQSLHTSAMPPPGRPWHVDQFIDKRIQLTLSDAGNELLPARAVHMNIIQAMATISLLDQEEDYPTHMEYAVAGMEYVTISIINRRDRSLKNKYALWALCTVGAAMALDERVGYRSRAFTVSWAGRVVGRILVFGAEIPPEPGEGDLPLAIFNNPSNDAARQLNAPPPPPLPSSIVSASSPHSSSISRPPVSFTAPSANLRVIYMPNNARPLSLAEVFLPLQKALVICASKANSERVGQSMTFVSHDVKMCFDYGDFPGFPQPFWSYRDAIMGLVMAARIVTETERLTEMTWMVEMGEKEVGIGSLWKDVEGVRGSLEASLHGMISFSFLIWPSS